MYLVHHGIKGQKWGVRRFQNEDRTWTAEGKIRYGNDNKPKEKIHLIKDTIKESKSLKSELRTYLGNKTGHYARNEHNVDLPKNDADAKKKGWIKLTDEQSAMHQNSKEGGVNNTKWISQDGHREVVFTGKGKNQHITSDVRDEGTYNYANPVENPLGHTVYDVLPYIFLGNEANDPTTTAGRLYVSAANFLDKDINFDPEKMSKGKKAVYELIMVHADIYSEELYHHGIKGQKWGIRRFQNPDGSYTEEGRKRYSKYIQKKIDKLYDGKDSPVFPRDKKHRKNEYEIALDAKGVEKLRQALHTSGKIRSDYNKACDEWAQSNEYKKALRDAELQFKKENGRLPYKERHNGVDHYDLDDIELMDFDTISQKKDTWINKHYNGLADKNFHANDIYQEACEQYVKEIITDDLFNKHLKNPKYANKTYGNALAEVFNNWAWDEPVSKDLVNNSGQGKIKNDNPQTVSRIFKDMSNIITGETLSGTPSKDIKKEVKTKANSAVKITKEDKNDYLKFMKDNLVKPEMVDDFELTELTVMDYLDNKYDGNYDNETYKKYVNMWEETGSEEYKRKRGIKGGTK